MFSSTFYPLGAQVTFLQSRIFLNSESRIDLYKEGGIPNDALILDVNCTGTGMFCTEMVGNSRRQRNRGHRLQLYGFQTYTLKDQGTAEAPVNIAVTWIRKSAEDVAWNSLVSAFDAYVDDDFNQAVIPANVAVEAKLYKYLESELNPYSSKDRLKTFLESAATYSHQLNVLLPYCAHWRAFPQLDDHIRGLLNSLRDARNDVAHRGECETPLTKDRCAELLTAALFGFRYVDLLAKKK